MPVITEKEKVRKIYENAQKKSVSLGIFGTASHWNAEAILLAADRYAKKHNIKNIPVVVNMTKEYVKEYGEQVFVEGIMDMLSVHGGSAVSNTDDYIERAVEYVKTTKVDFLVADLGTEQQSTSTGGSKYLKERARNLADCLNKPMLVLHGTSSLDEAQIRGLFEDGVSRVNMWTRIAWEAGHYAGQKLVERMEALEKGNFESIDSRQYIYDSIDKAADIMEHMMDLFGYSNLAE
jgi:fructose/tagatose bisphosphate aldolase